MLSLRMAAHWFQNHIKTGHTYLPDFIVYELDKDQYLTFWNSIKTHPIDQLYTDGLQVVKVSKLTALFESFKGWLGFDNHCQTNKVEMTLAKIAYYGYLKGFHTKGDLDFIPSPHFERFKSLIPLPRDNETSKELQQCLMAYYLTYSAYFPVLNPPILHAYPFGQTLMQQALPQFIPALDPQDNPLISQIITALDHRKACIPLSERYSSSSFAQAYADYWVQQGNYAQAINWSPNIQHSYPKEFIVFNKKKILTQFKKAIQQSCLKEARNLFEQNPDLPFDKKELLLLKNDYLNEIGSKSKLIDPALAQSNTTEAHTIALSLLSLAKKIAQITPQDTPSVEVQIIYAKTILRIDALLHPKVKDADLNKLNAASDLLTKLYFMNTSSAMKSTLNALLLRKIECLTEQIRVPVFFDTDLEQQNNFVKNHQAEIEALKKNLIDYITLNEASKENRPFLAKNHYLLGNVIGFIEGNRAASIPHFKKATEIMPENLYYKLRYYHSAGLKEYHDEIRAEIDQIEFDQGATYKQWMTERWHENPCISEGINIPIEPPPKRGLTERITGLFYSA